MLINLQDVIGSGCTFHHTATRAGYESRRGHGHFEPYSGRFGAGYVYVRPRYDTSRYVYIDYYLF